MKNIFDLKKTIAGILFLILGLYMATVVPTIEVAWVMGFLLLTIYLFAFEIVEVDVAAATIMVLLGLTTLFSPVMGIKAGLVDTQRLFDGFSSNAVMSIIAVMIIGAGLDKTGIMTRVASFILKIGGKTESRIIPIISATVAFISSFMQNVGAAALFLPVVSRISTRSGLPMSRLLMPMGFCAILGGTMTMVGSSPLILLNDLILTSNQSLPADQQMQTWGLFSVTPIGIFLVSVGIIYFVIAGRFVLPAAKTDSNNSKKDPMSQFRDVYHLNYKVAEVVITEGCDLIGKKLDDIETSERIRVIADKYVGGNANYGSGAIARDTGLEPGMVLGIVADPEDLSNFVEKYNLPKRDGEKVLSDVLESNKSGIAEIVIPPGSSLIGKSARDVWMRKTYGLSTIGLHRDGETMREGDNIRSIPFHAGDTLIVFTSWSDLERISDNKDFVVITTEYPKAEKLRPKKVKWAGLFFALALFMVLFTDIRLSIALLTGAMGMILSGVLKVEEAYNAVSWKTVFLLASLIPLGMAVETTGTAKWIAEEVVSATGNAAPWIIQSAIAVLATFFTLVMSNVGATVLLVPLAVNIAIQVGADPAIYALTVAIATSNSFLIPTHQVNALIMGPGGYRVADFMKAGGIMTVLFLVVMMTMMNIFL